MEHLIKYKNKNLVEYYQVCVLILLWHVSLISTPSNPNMGRDYFWESDS